MVDRALINQLQSLNVGQRKDAILALGRTKDREAIPHLARVAENDPDDELRELARKAVIYIEKNAPNVKPFKMPWDDEDAEAEESAAESESSGISGLPEYTPPTDEEIAERQDREWAERLIERAWAAHYTGDKEGAEAYLQKAFERAPQIADVDSAREAAGKIMGMNPDRAVNALLKPKTQRRPASMSRKPATMSAKPPTASRKPEVKEKTIDEIEDGSMSTLLLDLFIFFLAVFVFNFALLFIATALVGSELNSEIPADATPELRELAEGILAGSLGGAITYAASTAIGTLLQTLFFWVVTHLVASTLVGGNSTFPRLVRKTYPFFALFTPVMLILSLVSVLLGATLNDPSLIYGLLGLTALGSIFMLAWRIGVAYRFDISRGCFTMILTVIAYICCAVTLVLALMSADVGPFAGLLDMINAAR